MMTLHHHLMSALAAALLLFGSATVGQRIGALVALVARVALPNGSDYVVAVFTKGVKEVPEVIPRAYEKVAAHFLAAGS
mgnify:CR=1 FL=1